MKKAKKERQAGASSLMARLLSNLDGNALRGGKYLRGAVMAAKDELKALIGLDFMANGAIYFPLSSRDLIWDAKTNTLGEGIRAYVQNGRHLETIEINAQGQVVRAPFDDTMLREASLMWKGYAYLEQLRERVVCAVMPGRCIGEMSLGFAPYILLGIRNDIGGVTFVRISMQDSNQAALTWNRAVYQAFQPIVF